MKIIVLSINPYKEKDGVITAVSEEGEISLTAKGIFDPKGKLAALNNAMTIADVEIGDSRYKYPVIKSYQIIESPLKSNGDLMYLGGLMLLNEITKKLLQEDEKAMLFKHLCAAIISLKAAKEPWMVLLVYLANVFKATGSEFEVDHCVRCGTRKGIKTFSFKEGGFICENCLESDMERPFNNDQKLLFRAAFMASDYAHVHECCNKENALVILNRCNEYINEAYGANLTALTLLNGK